MNTEYSTVEDALRDEVAKLQDELRVARIASHVGQSCEMLAARLVAVEKERAKVRDEVARLNARLGERAEYESGVHCAHGVSTCDRCSEAWSAERRQLRRAEEKAVSARKLLGHAFAENTRLADVARRQREACAAACVARRPSTRDWRLGGLNVHTYDAWSEAEAECLNAPLVTEEES